MMRILRIAGVVFAAAACTGAALALQVPPATTPPASVPPATSPPVAPPAATPPSTTPAPRPPPPPSVPARPLAPPPEPAELLSTIWLQRALAMVGDPDIGAEGLEAMLGVAETCGTLTPNRTPPWRIVMLLADQLEVTRPDLAIAARRSALANLSRLEPHNDSITLARLTDAIEANGTAEERVRAYEKLLDPANATRLDAAIRSRLAFQLAMLQNRMGNIELFARWLGESVKIDPSFAQGTLTAAGFFRTRVDDPAADVELLSLAITANPRSLSTWSALITVLLDAGAFKAAERAVRDALIVARDERQWPAINNLSADLAMALWGQGRRDEAKREMRNRLRTITEDYRRMIQFSDATLTADRINLMDPPLPASLSVAALALIDPVKETAEFNRLVRQALQINESEMAILKKDGVGPILDTLVDKATVSLLFNKNPTEVGELVKEARTKNLLSEPLFQRMSGMLAWRSNKLDEAIALLEPLRERDPLARYCYASALLDAGRTQDSAREFQALAKSNVGSTVGLAALDRLSSILNKEGLLTSHLSKEIAERGALLDDALDKYLPKALDELVAYPMRAFAVTAQAITNAAGDSAAPYSTLGVRISIRNTSPLPFAIGITDPLRSHFVMRTELSKTGVEDKRPIPQITIPFDQGLQLAPNEELEFDLDIANTPLGVRLMNEPLTTALVTVSFVTNPQEVGYGAMPGFMGTVANVAPFVVTGTVVTPEWVAESLAVIAGPRSSTSLVRLALLIHAAANPDDRPEAARPALRAPEVWKAIVDAWGTLNSTEQAWIVAVLPKEGSALAPLLEVVRTSTAPEVLASWLLSRVVEPTDPMLDVARRTGVQRLIKLADSAAWVATRRQKRVIEDLGVEEERKSLPNSGGMTR